MCAFKSYFEYASRETIFIACRTWFDSISEMTKNYSQGHQTLHASRPIQVLCHTKMASSALSNICFWHANILFLLLYGNPLENVPSLSGETCEK